MADFNLFDILWRKLKESDHDPLLAWLLDPNENHPFGSAVLDAVIDHLYGSRIPKDELSVSLQYALDPSSFPDITIEGNRSLIIIENKVFNASIDAGQIVRYLELGKNKAEHRQFFLILMSPSSRAATDIIPDPPKAFAVLQWALFAQIIDEQKSKLEISGFFDEIFDQYRDYIQQTIISGGGRGFSVRHPSRSWNEELFLSEAENAIDPQTFNSMNQIVVYLKSKYDPANIRFGKGSTIGTLSLIVQHANRDVRIFNMNHEGGIVPYFGDIEQFFGGKIGNAYRQGIEKIFGPNPKLEKKFPFLALQSINEKDKVADFLKVVDQVFSLIQAEKKAD